jgi:hypothetical protein
MVLLGTGCHTVFPLEERRGPETGGLDAQATDRQIERQTADGSTPRDAGADHEAAVSVPDAAPPDDTGPDGMAADTAPTPDVLSPDLRPPDLFTPDVTAPPDTAPHPDVASTPDTIPSADTAPPPDVASPPDTAPPPDTGVGNPLNIVVTEIMVNPIGDEPTNEWFEVYNKGPGTVSLLNWEIGDTTATHKIIKDVPVPPNTYVVLAAVVNTKVGSAYAYNPSASTQGISLANAGDKLTLHDEKGSPVEEVVFPSSWGSNEGSSWSLANPDLDSSDTANWCQEISANKYDGKNKGTPGQAAGCP